MTYTHIYDFPDNLSSLIDGVMYDKDSGELCVVFKKYYTPMLHYEEVPFNIFQEFINSKSLGKYFLTKIKPIFKLKKFTMATEKNRPKGVNKAKSDGKRFIRISIDVKKINKDYLHVGEKGVYLNATLMMLPDGTVDAYENLGMIVQEVPEKVRKADKDSKGEILGNARENEWAERNSEGVPGQETGKLLRESDGVADDLPF